MILRSTCGKEILVDDEDGLLLSRFNWNISLGGYARTSIGDNRLVFIHRLVMGTPARGYSSSVVIDHINQNPLDNRKENLRWASRAENRVNSNKVKSGWGYKGIRPYRDGKWSAYIQLKGKQKYLGIYDSKEEAAKAYQKAVKEEYA